MNNFEDCKVIDIFNLEFCESTQISLEPAVSEFFGVPCFSF